MPPQQTKKNSVQGYVRLIYQKGVSNKEYHLSLYKEETGYYTVEAQYGRVGGTLQVINKTPTPLTCANATQVFIACMNEKIGKGYVVNNSFGLGAPLIKGAEQLQNKVQKVKKLPVEADFYEGFKPLTLVAIPRHKASVKQPPVVVDDFLAEPTGRRIRDVE